MESTLSTGKAAKLLGVSVKTLQRWEREGRLIPVARTDSNRRLYTEAQIREFIGLRQANHAPTKLVAYCRVSSAAQKPDLANQRRVLEEFVAAKGLAGVEFIEEVGGGLNFKRKRFLELMDAIGRREIKMLILAHRDRLTRFGFEWFEHFAKINGCELLVLNQERLSPEQEMVQDLMTIVHCFSSRLYGLRNYRKKLDEALKQDANSAQKAQPCN
jgi:predicted site-specific integrase-resolvase